MAALYWNLLPIGISFQTEEQAKIFLPWPENMDLGPGS